MDTVFFSYIFLFFSDGMDNLRLDGVVLLVVAFSWSYIAPLDDARSFFLTAGWMDA